MSHLSDMRIMELALPGVGAPVNGEAAHLASCERCSARLAEERALTEGLSLLAEPPPPESFADATVDAFRQRIRTRGLRQLRGALAVALVLAAAIVGVIVAAGDSLATYAAESVAQAGTLAEALFTVTSALPTATILVLAGTCLAGLLLIPLLVKMGGRRHEVKYLEGSSVSRAGNGE